MKAAAASFSLFNSFEEKKMEAKHDLLWQPLFGL